MRFALLALALPLCAQPHLLLDKSDVVRIQALASKETWAAEIRNDLIQRADQWPAPHVREFGLSEWALPKEGAGWSHAYVCPEHGMRLTQKAGKNLCPVDGKDYHGWPVDHVVYMQRNGDNARASRDLGLAWQLTGKPVYAEKARRILNAYSAIYPTLPIHDNTNRIDTRTGARIMSQTLSEASWLVPLVFAYDLVRETMTSAERARFETDVLRNAAAVISRHNAGKSNWQSWHNAALLAVGVTVADRDLINKAIDGPGGFKSQLRESITPDGPWYEGAWGYHFFAFEPLMLTLEMAQRAGVAVPESAALKRMLDAPLRSVFPDGTLPNFNDSNIVRLAGSARHYDIGYRLFKEPRYLAVVRGSKRSLDSMLWGAPSLAAAESPKLGSELLPAAGIATLRVRESDHTLAIKFGPHGGGHGHFDKLSFVSFANGKHLAADPGTQAYAAKSHATWDKLTVAHNTITVDEHTQVESTGRLLDWTPLPSATMIRLSAGPAYPGVELERTIVHTAGYTLDIFNARSTDLKPHHFDWLYHNYGKLSSALEFAPYADLPRASGYQHLTEAAAVHTADSWQATFAQEEANVRFQMIGEPGTTVLSGQGLGPDLRVPVPFVMARRRGTEAHFIALYEPYTTQPLIRSLRKSSPNSFVIEAANKTDEISLEAGKFSLYQKLGGKPARLIVSGVTRHALVEFEKPIALQVNWSSDGRTVNLSTSEPLTQKIRLRASAASTFTLNGKQVSAQRDGDYWTISPQ